MGARAKRLIGSARRVILMSGADRISPLVCTNNRSPNLAHGCFSVWLIAGHSAKAVRVHYCLRGDVDFLRDGRANRLLCRRNMSVLNDQLNGAKPDVVSGHSSTAMMRPQFDSSFRLTCIKSICLLSEYALGHGILWVSASDVIRPGKACETVQLYRCDDVVNGCHVSWRRDTGGTPFA